MANSPTKRWLHVRPILLLLLTAMLIGSTAHTVEAQTEAGQTVESRKSPWLAFGLSFLIPGAGQAYNGQWAKGGLMFGGVAAFAVVMASDFDNCEFVYATPQAPCGVFWAGLVGAGLFALWSWIDAPIAANAINRRIDAGQVALEIGPQLVAPNADSRVGLSLVRVRF